MLSILLMDEPDLKDVVHPVSCQELTEGLLFAFSNGTTKLIPKFTPPFGRYRFDEDKEYSDVS